MNITGIVIGLVGIVAGAWIFFGEHDMTGLVGFFTGGICIAAAIKAKPLA